MMTLHWRLGTLCSEAPSSLEQGLTVSEFEGLGFLVVHVLGLRVDVERSGLRVHGGWKDPE